MRNENPFAYHAAASFDRVGDVELRSFAEGKIGEEDLGGGAEVSLYWVRCNGAGGLDGWSMPPGCLRGGMLS